MEFCHLGWIVLLLSIIGYIMDIIISGFNIFAMIMKLIFTTLYVLLTNWACNTDGFYWLAVIITFLHSIGIIFTLIFFSIKRSGKDLSDILVDISDNK